MEVEVSQGEDSGAKEIPSSEEGIGVQNNESQTQNLDLFSSFFPVPIKALLQKSKNKEGEANMDAPDFSNLQRSSSSSTSTCSKSKIERKMKSSKRESKPHLDQKSKLQYLIDFKCPRIDVQEIPYDPLSKHSEKIQIFQLITLDGQPVKSLVLCSKCNRLLVRYKPSATNLIRHFERHKKRDVQDRISSRINKDIRKYMQSEMPRPDENDGHSSRSEGIDLAVPKIKRYDQPPKSTISKISKTVRVQIVANSDDSPGVIVIPGISETITPKVNQCEDSQEFAQVDVACELDPSLDDATSHLEKDKNNLESGVIQETQRSRTLWSRARERNWLADREANRVNSAKSNFMMTPSDADTSKQDQVAEETQIKIE
ncbi:MAG: hypothetical protein FD122_3767 [Stygiobacter sp.]|nr:MAG: hypothetical protein FD122_3767 [Stygiobacter sp.]